MGQVKKVEVREAILRAAFKLFSRHGFAKTTIARIAANAGVSSANLYVYFGSKLEILYEIYDPWMRARLDRLEAELASIEGGATAQVRHVLATIWRDIPVEANGFANNVMQALAGYEQGQGYRPTLLAWMEAKIDRMIRAVLPAARHDALGDAELAHLIVMAFDGFVLNRRVEPLRRCDDATLDWMTGLLAGKPASPTVREPGLRPARPRRPPKLPRLPMADR